MSNLPKEMNASRLEWLNEQIAAAKAQRILYANLEAKYKAERAQISDMFRGVESANPARIIQKETEN